MIKKDERGQEKITVNHFSKRSEKIFCPIFFSFINKNYVDKIWIAYMVFFHLF